MMPKIKLGDVEIFYETHGAGTPLLLVPGLGGVGNYWNANIPAFSQNTR
jgi:aminoacrylate hydrolase